LIKVTNDKKKQKREKIYVAGAVFYFL